MDDNIANGDGADIFFFFFRRTPEMFSHNSIILQYGLRM